jgi:hypothetical protein
MSKPVEIVSTCRIIEMSSEEDVRAFCCMPKAFACTYVRAAFVVPINEVASKKNFTGGGEVGDL